VEVVVVADGVAVVLGLGVGHAGRLVGVRGRLRVWIGRRGLVRHRREQVAYVVAEGVDLAVVGLRGGRTVGVVAVTGGVLDGAGALLLYLRDPVHPVIGDCICVDRRAG